MWSYQKYFVYKSARIEQQKAIEFAIDSFVKNQKRFVIVEAGTGVGKSAIGFSVARYINDMFSGDSYFLTTQKILQEQYVKDFSHFGLNNLKSSSNYLCSFYKGAQSCSAVLRELKVTNNQKLKQCCGGGNCHYSQEKKRFISGNFGITNFSYFLAETNYSGQLQKRELLVIDEAHNIEIELSKFVEVSISEHFSEKILKLKVPKDIKSQFAVHKWIMDSYLPKLLKIKKHFEKTLEKFNISQDKLKDFLQISSKFDLIDKHACKIERFLDVYEKDNWVLNISETEKAGSRKFEFKPIDISHFTESNLFNRGNKILMMSATIMDKDAFCESLGIDKNDCDFISLPSPFKKENKPILFSPVGSMAMKSIDQTLPKMALAVKAILDNHPNEKGIIHCHSYKIAKYLEENVKSDRILTHDSENRDRILFMHTNESKPTVILSPSMSEGVDLKGDASRFQVICKIPYPYLGDKLVKKRMNKWKWWYSLQTAKTIVQSVGRSIRTETDHAVTYILDEDWNRFYEKNKSIFPKDFKDCIL